MAVVGRLDAHDRVGHRRTSTQSFLRRVTCFCGAQGHRGVSARGVDGDRCASASTASDQSSAGRVKGVEIDVSIKDGAVKPEARRVTVTEGTRVRLVITSDVADEVHVHGYDIEQEVPAGPMVTIPFVADRNGVFEVETHESGLQLLQLEVS